MRPSATTSDFRPGFRLYPRDVAVLVIGAAGTIWVAQLDAWLGVAIAFTVGHFFLFCNVLRMSRPYELAWAALFVLLAASTMLNELPGWGATMALMLGVTAVVAALQMRRPSYHGVLWQRINPGLREWWAARQNG